MKQTLTGEFSNLEVGGSTITVNGAVRGAQVAADGCLVVNGAFDGALAVAEGGSTFVNGAFAPSSLDNAGLVVAAGVVHTDLAFDDMGHFCVALGTLVGHSMVEPDGGLAVAQPNVTVDGDVLFVWLPEEQRFVPMTEIKSRNAEALGE